MNTLSNIKKIKVLITGANGFVGSNLTKYLSRDENFEIYAMVRPRAPVNYLHQFQFKENKKEKWFELTEANLNDEESLFQAAKNKDVIVHLAGFVSDWGEKERYWQLNVEGTKNILKAATRANVSRVLFLSSLSVHSLNGHRYDDEKTPRDVKKFLYGVTKRIGEDLVFEWGGKSSENSSAVIRPGFIIFGPYDKNSFILTLEAMKSGKFGLINGGKSLISYVYVENLCYGINQLIKAEKIEGAYNILDGNMEWKKWVEIWAKAMKIKSPRLKIPYFVLVPIVGIMVVIYKIFNIKKSPPLNFYRIGIMRKDLAFTNDKISKEIGYSPPINLEEGVKRTLEFFLEEYK